MKDARMENMTEFVIGFTGTRNGMTSEQKEGVERLLTSYCCKYGDSNLVGLHGDCVGADADFDALCRRGGYAFPVECRPCTFENMRARTAAKVIAPPMPPMERNRWIVRDSNVILACPPNDTEIKSGSGTWATIRFAKKEGKAVHIFFPNGSIDYVPERKM